MSIAHKVITVLMGWKQCLTLLSCALFPYFSCRNRTARGCWSQRPVTHDCRQHLCRTLLRAAPLLCAGSLQVKGHFPAFSCLQLIMAGGRIYRLVTLSRLGDVMHMILCSL